MLGTFGVLCRRCLPAISSDGRKKMGSRDKLHEDMNGWPWTGWNGKPRAPDSILIIRATTINKSETRNNTVYTVTESSLTFWIFLTDQYHAAWTSPSPDQELRSVSERDASGGSPGRIGSKQNPGPWNERVYSPSSYPEGAYPCPVGNITLK